MAFRQAQENLTLGEMEKASILSVGHGDMTERAFFEVLQVNAIRVLYDTWPTDYRHEMLGIPERFSVRTLKMSCKARGIFYKQAIIGKESAYGTLAHLRSQQGKHVLVELAWQGKRKRTAFLGRSCTWKDDPRLAIAEDLCVAGHLVEHILSDGSRERHVRLDKMPDWLQGEEERLRKLEKQRQAGGLRRPEKSAADRSTETVVSQLMRPAVEVDAIMTLQEAETQPELQQVQQKVVRLQRQAEQKGVLGKVLTHVPQFIKEEARAQADWIAQRKKQEETLEASSTKACSSKVPQSESMYGDVAEECQIQVERASCGTFYDRAHLQLGNGVCFVCSASSSGSEPQANSSHATCESSGCPVNEDLEVECQSCAKLWPWPVLAVGDGRCPTCFDQMRSPDTETSQPLHTLAAASSWRARRRQAAAA